MKLRRSVIVRMRRELLASALIVTLSGCATQGRVFDDEPARHFTIGVTTPDQAISALGPPTRDWTRPDGLRIVDWQYQRRVVIAPYVRRVRANFRDGRLVYLHAPRKDEEVAVF